MSVKRGTRKELSVEELLVALKKVTQSLDQHIRDQAKEKNVAKEQFCPCWENELLEAKQAIAKAEGK